MLRGLNGALLDFLYQRATCTELTTRGQFDVDFAVAHVLDVFLEIQLHDGVAARRTQHVGRRDRHLVFGGFFASTFFLASCRGSFFADQQTATGARDHGGGKAVFCAGAEKSAALQVCWGILIVFHFVYSSVFKCHVLISLVCLPVNRLRVPAW